jgi:hypothetical protein
VRECPSSWSTATWPTGLRDAVLVGCGSGTGAVTRYLGTYGQRGVRAAALLASLPPYLPRPAASADGAGQGILDHFRAELAADRPAAVKAYLDRYYNIDVLGGTRVTDQGAPRCAGCATPAGRSHISHARPSGNTIGRDRGTFPHWGKKPSGFGGVVSPMRKSSPRTSPGSASRS